MTAIIILAQAVCVVALEALLAFVAAALEPLAIYCAQFTTPRGAG